MPHHASLVYFGTDLETEFSTIKPLLKLKELELKDDGMKYTDKNAPDG